MENIIREEISGLIKLTAKDGYFIHLPEHESEDDEEFYTTKVVFLQPDYDFNKIIVLSENELIQKQNENDLYIEEED